MKHDEQNSRHLDSAVGVMRPLVHMLQIMQRREVTTYLGKTGGSCFRERSPPSRSVGWRGIDP